MTLNCRIVRAIILVLCRLTYLCTYLVSVPPTSLPKLKYLVGLSAPALISAKPYTRIRFLGDLLYNRTSFW